MKSPAKANTGSFSGGNAINPAAEIAYEVVIPVSPRNLDSLVHVTLPMLRKHLSPEKIIVIGTRGLQPAIEKSGCVFIDEDKLRPGMTLDSIRNALIQRGADPRRAGWYFQQFLKMEYCRHAENAYYLSWDADTIPLRPISFFDPDGKVLYYPKDEFHRPYFDTIRTLFDGQIRKMIPSSFIAEHMMFDRILMANMLNDIECNSALGGEMFFEKILNAVPFEALSGSGFSEFETFGNWMLCKAPEKYRARPLKSLREGSLFLGSHPTARQCDYAARFYDIVSIEAAGGIKKAACLAISCLTACLVIPLRLPLPKIVLPYHALKRVYYKWVKGSVRFDPGK